MRKLTENLHSIRILTCVQLLLLLADLILTLFAEYLRHSFYYVTGLYLFQFLTMSLNLILLLVRFTYSYAFRAGVVRIMINEFSGCIWISGVYMTAFVVCRIYGLVLLPRYTNLSPALVQDFWDPGYLAVYVIFRLVSIAYYYAFKSAILKICHPKYYSEAILKRDTMF
ncbi:uncharacterized protein BJ171DRAFT_15037 [Polychytrium aggregatum]|uniref:uncharacterized protein n=1 Tax=Polychytrium aggregatum TaxID=110093 RepID=UPI0022FF4063|nr:uncharacterized protein BJ171DRAFT_15037 [Polychytrium aggregatum]KAI9206580.1 hypothetical protein BJ171DRAFT_15037 [Polychytrium aggregatum]